VHRPPRTGGTARMTEQHPITPPPELVEQWVAATEPS